VLKSIQEKTIILGVINLGEADIETPEIVLTRIRNALKYLAAEKLIVAPDCGIKYLERSVAFAKLRAMVQATKMLSEELH